MRSRRTIAVSDATAADLHRFYRFPKARTDVVPHGVDPEFYGLQSASRNQSRMILCVSTLHPHKNIGNLLEAFSRLHADRPEYTLTVAGMRGFHAETLERQRSQLHLETAVNFTGWIPREDLYDLYRKAAAFIYPSRFEGFGMPILEALAAGIPTACSRLEPMGSLAEDAALTFDPDDISGMHHALQALTSDERLRARLSEAGPRRASGFTWETSARATLKSLLAAL